MNFKRILTSLLGTPAVIVAVFLGNNYILGILILIVSILSMHEFFNAIKKIAKPIEWVGYLSNIFIILATLIEKEKIFPILIFIFPILMLMLFLQVIFTEMKYTIKDCAYTLLGIIYIPFFLTFMELIKKLDNGAILVGYGLTVAWCTDILAYLVGKNWGKIKFSKISPKKTIEGCIAGIIGAILGCFIYLFIVNKIWGIKYEYTIIICTVFLSILSQFGDFVASTIKRFVDIKDYGTLLPGHGGMLDRIDSVIFIMPFLYMIFFIAKI